MTTPLRVALTNSFSPLAGTTLTTNFPVSLNELLASTALYRGFTVTESGSIRTTITPEKNEDGTPSETRFRIIAQSQPFTYNTDYTIQVHTTLRPKYGTEPLAQEVSTPVHTTDFVTSLRAVQNIFDSSGTLSNTRDYAVSSGILPSERLFFLVDFDTEMPLDRTLVSLR